MALPGPENNKKTLSEINVTPLVDVMLVLLVIFMVTAPLMLNGINLELPRTKEVNPMQLNTKQIVLSLSSSGDLFLGKKKVLKSELIKLIRAKMLTQKSKVVYLRADYTLKYGKVAKLISFLKHGGISSIALITQLEE